MSKKSTPTRFSAQEMAALDRRYIWHPFTQMADWVKEDPLIVAAGEGSYLIDVWGRRYLDGVSSLWVNLHGHRRQEIDRAVVAQLGRIAHSTFLGLSNPPAIELAKELVEVAPPGLEKVFYSDNGSTAVEVALKMAFQYWQQCPERQPSRTSFITFVNGYHGDTIGSVSLGGNDLFHRIYHPLLFQTVKVRSPYCYRCPWGKEYPGCHMSCLEEVAEAMRRNRDRVAAVVIEPLVQAAGGMLVFPSGYTRRVRELAAEHRILFIADEVATGFGRTGSLFACEREQVQPDLLAVAKGISGGYLPLAATLTTEEIFLAFCGEYDQQKTFFHGHSYTANPLACAAALANLEIFRREDTLGHLQGKIACLKDGLTRFWELEHVGDIRQVGFMVGIELVRRKDSREPYPYKDKMGIRVVREARKKGLILRPLENVIVLMPPLSISLPELGELLAITYDAIEEVTEKGRGE